MRINETVKELRLRENMTQAELAEKLNCNRQKIADWERGKTTPAADDIILLAKIFDVTSDYLLGLAKNPSTDVRHVELTELTGLDDNAIDDLAMEYLAGWRDDNPLANHIMNAFISSGIFDELLSEMTDYGRSLRDYISELETIYQKAHDTYEQMGLRIVVTDEYRMLSSAARGSDTSTNKQNMKLSLFDMAELPKEFVKAYFTHAQKKQKEIEIKIEKLDAEIKKKSFIEKSSIVEKIEKERREKEVKQNSNNPKT